MIITCSRERGSFSSTIVRRSKLNGWCTGQWGGIEQARRYSSPKYFFAAAKL
jgi:hypothetical protein